MRHDVFTSTGAQTAESIPLGGADDSKEASHVEVEATNASTMIRTQSR